MILSSLALDVPSSFLKNKRIIANNSIMKPFFSAAVLLYWLVGASSAKKCRPYCEAAFVTLCVPTMCELEGVDGAEARRRCLDAIDVYDKDASHFFLIFAKPSASLRL